MPWNNGTFTGLYNWNSDKANGIKIRADRHTEQDDTFITGINTCLTKDGQNSPTANLPMATYRHLNVSNATERNQYLALGQFQDNSGKYFDTIGSSNTYVVTASPVISSYVEGLSFYIKASFTNTGAATLNVNALGAKSITKNGTGALASGDIESGSIYEVIYDGTQFQITRAVDQIITLTGDVTGSGTGSFAATIPDNTVTFAKMQDIDTSKILGRTTASSGDVEELDFLDEDDMSSDSATAVATQQSIKAYVDAESAAVTTALNASGLLPTAWCTFDGTASDPITINDGYNVTDVTKNSTGDYTVNFTSAVTGTSYGVLVMCTNQDGNSAIPSYANKATSSVDILIETATQTTTQDQSDISVFIFSKE